MARAATFCAESLLILILCFTSHPQCKYHTQFRCIFQHERYYSIDLERYYCCSRTLLQQSCCASPAVPVSVPSGGRRPSPPAASVPPSVPVSLWHGGRRGHRRHGVLLHGGVGGLRRRRVDELALRRRHRVAVAVAFREPRG